MNGSAAVLEAALELAEEGLPIFPCQQDKRPYPANGFKSASVDPAEIKRWWRCWPGALVGVPTGRASGLLVIDIDPEGAGWHRENDHRLGCGRVHRTRRGHHLLYQYPGIEIRNSAGRIAPGVDVRAESGYVIWWPLHGHAAIGGLEDLGPLPDWLLSDLTNSAPHAQGAGEYIIEGQRNDFLSREAYRFRKKGFSTNQLAESLQALNNARCRPPLPHAEVVGIANGKARVSPDGAAPWAGDLPPIESYAGDAAGPGNGASPAADCESRVILTRGDAMSVRPVRWTWEGYLARSKLHVLAGAIGTGKSTLALAMAAVVSVGGRWPDGTKCSPGDVLIWSDEDDPEDTLLPRFLAAGGDPRRIHFVTGTVDRDGKRHFDPATDIPGLIAAARTTTDLGLVIVDPVVTVVAGDSHKNTEVRRSLRPLVGLASEVVSAVLGITHHTKGTAGRDPVERITGSLAFGALPRVTMAAARDGTDPDRRIFCRTKSNIGPDTGGWEYRLALTDVPGVEGVSVVRVQWGDFLEGSAKDLLAGAEAPAVDPEERSKLDEAVDWLGKLLKDGPVDSQQIAKDARQSGIARPTIERAKACLGVKSRKASYSGVWRWSLPEHNQEPVGDGLGHPENDSNPQQPQNDDHLGNPTPLEPSCGAGSTQGDQAPEEAPPSTPLEPSCGAGSTQGDQAPEKNEGVDHLGSNLAVVRVPGVFDTHGAEGVDHLGSNLAVVRVLGDRNSQDDQGFDVVGEKVVQPAPPHPPPDTLVHVTGDDDGKAEEPPWTTRI